MLNIVCIEGDGIGPEVTRAMKKVVDAAASAQIRWIDRPAGLSALATHGNVLPAATVEAIALNQLAIKGPTNTPKGDGHESVNVRLRKIFDLEVGFRPFRSLIPGTPRVDILLYRQNTEGLYACREETSFNPAFGETVTLTSRFTRGAMLRLAARAFDDASKMGRARVTLVTKSNIHKGWGKLYRDAFMEVARAYPSIEHEEMLVDAAAMTLSTNPSRLDVIVTENMFGDILSDQCAGLIGGLGVAPGANLGADRAIFEAVHGSADDIAGKDLANPTALILSAAMLLRHAGQEADAARIETAVRAVIGAGTHVTGDLARHYSSPRQSSSTVPCGTTAFTDAVVARL